MAALIGVIGTLLGVALGGWVALTNARKQQRHQDEKEMRRLILSKMEELFIIVEKHRTLTSKDVALVRGRGANRIQGAPDWSEGISRDDEIPSQEKTDMLVLFYVPEIIEEYREFMESFTETRYHVLGLLLAYQENANDQEKKEIAVRIGSEFHHFEKASNVVRSGLLKRAKALLWLS